MNDKEFRKYLMNHEDIFLDTLLVASDKEGVIKGLTLHKLFSLSGLDINELYNGINLLASMEQKKYIEISYENDMPIIKIINKYVLDKYNEEKYLVDKSILKEHKENDNIELKQLRKYQIDIIETVNQTSKNILIELPTGSGKTLIGYHIANNELQKNGTVLFLTPKLILLDQTLNVFANLNPYKYHKKNTSTSGKKLFISTLQTIYIRGIPSDTTLIIIDEAHFGHSGEMQSLIKKNYNGRTVALSATPYDVKGFPLKGYDTHLKKYDISYMVKNKYLVPYNYFKVLNVNLNGISSLHGDYNANELYQVYKDVESNQAIVEATKNHLLQRKKILVFAINIVHCESLAKAYQEIGIPSRAIHSKLHKKEQTNILDAFQYGDIKLLVSVEQLTFGFDAPIADTIIFARPTKSFNLYQQMVGRVLRPYKSKENALLLDCAGLIESLGLPDKRKLPQDVKEYDLTNPDSKILSLNVKKINKSKIQSKSLLMANSSQKDEQVILKKELTINNQNKSNIEPLNEYVEKDKNQINILDNNENESYIECTRCNELIKNDKYALHMYTKHGVELKVEKLKQVSLDIVKHKTKIEEDTNTVLEPSIINDEEKYRNDIQKKIIKDQLIYDNATIKEKKTIIVKKENVQEKENKFLIGEFLYKQYQGYCQICEFTFKKRDGKNSFEIFSWNDMRILKEKQGFITSSYSLCLCRNCSANIKWGAFEAIFINKFLESNLKNNTDIQFVKEVLHNPIENHQLKIFQELLDFDEMYALEIMLNNEKKNIYFTNEHLIQFIAYLQQE